MRPRSGLPRTHVAARGALLALVILAVAVLTITAHRAGLLPDFFDRLSVSWRRATEWARS